MADENKRPGFGGIGGIGEGIRTGIGILSALGEAVEETLEEAVKRGDLSPDRARQAMRDAAEKLQGSFERVGDRLDVVSRKEYDDLRAELAELRERVARLESSGPSPESPSMIAPE